MNTAEVERQDCIAMTQKASPVSHQVVVLHTISDTVANYMHKKCSIPGKTVCQHVSFHCQYRAQTTGRVCSTRKEAKWRVFEKIRIPVTKI